MRTAAAIVSALLAAPLAAAPFPKGDAKLGAELERQHCVACHVGLVGGDGNEIYTRLNRLVQTAEALAQRIAACSSQTNAALFPEEEEHIAAYLNGKFYRFK
jgi:mono/diheme cytochrome c family protein